LSRSKAGMMQYSCSSSSGIAPNANDHARVAFRCPNSHVFLQLFCPQARDLRPPQNGQSGRRAAAPRPSMPQQRIASFFPLAFTPIPRGRQETRACVALLFVPVASDVAPVASVRSIAMRPRWSRARRQNGDYDVCDWQLQEDRHERGIHR
jgi:hypothetical protein